GIARRLADRDVAVDAEQFDRHRRNANPFERDGGDDAPRTGLGGGRLLAPRRERRRNGGGQQDRQHERASTGDSERPRRPAITHGVAPSFTKRLPRTSVPQARASDRAFMPPPVV